MSKEEGHCVKGRLAGQAPRQAVRGRTLHPGGGSAGSVGEAPALGWGRPQHQLSTWT